MVLSPEDLVDLHQPANVKLCSSGDLVAFEVAPVGRKGKTAKSAIWVASTSKEYSAKQLTSGEYNDVRPLWRSNSEIVFLSDRSEPGVKSDLCSVKYPDGDIKLLLSGEGRKQVSEYALSPCGNWITYCSQDEESEEQKRRVEEGNDARLYGQESNWNRARLLDLRSCKVDTIFAQKAHVWKVAWSLDSKTIAITTTKLTSIESGIYDGTVIWLYDMEQALLTRVVEFPNEIDSIVSCNNDIFFLGGLTPFKFLTAKCVFRIAHNSSEYQVYAFGQDETVEKLLGGKRVTALVHRGLQDEIHSLDPNKLIHQQESAITSMDVIDEVLVTISGGPCQPNEVYSWINGQQRQLTKHASWQDFAHVDRIYCHNQDRVLLDGLFVKPKNIVTRVPTILLIHGGPYFRSSVQYDLHIRHTVPYLVTSGYAALFPNYRGSCGRGEVFTAQAQGISQDEKGSVEFQDVMCFLKEAIARGLVDSKQVVVGGWSYGGYLSYFATISDFGFRGAIVGAGVNDWNTMSMISDAPRAHCELGGGAPWDLPSSQARNPISHLDKVRMPMLLLHGEDDERVPISQAKAWYQASRRLGLDCELVIYPRVGHRPEERLHLIDIISRVKEFCDKCLT